MLQLINLRPRRHSTEVHHNDNKSGKGTFYHKTAKTHPAMSGKDHIYNKMCSGDQQAGVMMRDSHATSNCKRW